MIAGGACSTASCKSSSVRLRARQPSSVALLKFKKEGGVLLLRWIVNGMCRSRAEPHLPDKRPGNRRAGFARQIRNEIGLVGRPRSEAISTDLPRDLRSEDMAIFYQFIGPIPAFGHL